MARKLSRKRKLNQTAKSSIELSIFTRLRWLKKNPMNLQKLQIEFVE